LLIAHKRSYGDEQSRTHKDGTDEGGASPGIQYPRVPGHEVAETYPLEKAAEAYARMLSGKAEFRVVSTM